MFQVLAATIWLGTVETELVGDQPGAQHTSRTSIEIRLEERARADGGRELVATRARYRTSTTITGSGSCTGTSDEDLADVGIKWTIDARGSYTATIPRGLGGWTCGHDVRAAGARDADVGHGQDPDARHVSGDRLVGSYVATRRTVDTRYRIRVRWELRRR